MPETMVTCRTHLQSGLRWAWGQWWLVMTVWFVCAIWVVAAVKHSTHKSMLSVYGNGIVGTLIVAPCALSEGLQPLRAKWRVVLLIAVLSALERNLTNSALYSIGGALKTALHGFNVLVTFFVAALLGVDKRSQSCLFGCRCRGNLALVPVLVLVASGGVVTALCGKGSWHGSATGICLQLASSIAYALKYSLMKLLLGHGHSGPQENGSSCSLTPSKMQIAVVAQPVTGIVAMCFLPFFESDWSPPPISVFISFGFGVTGILIFELQLVQLTSPLTVSILSAVHNVIIVLFFVIKDNEQLSSAQMAGFAVSSIGVAGYAWLKHAQAKETDGIADARSLRDIPGCLEESSAAAGLTSRPPPSRGTDVAMVETAER